MFLKKAEIFGVHLSLYLFCHLLLLTILCAFFTISTIKKIWTQNNFPDIQFYLLYGFLSNIIVWIIYRIFICILDIQDNIKDLVKFKNDLKNKENNENNENNENKNDDYENDTNLLDDKINELEKNYKFKIIIFFILIFVITFICLLYLISFFAIYTGTKSKVLEAYMISLIEIILIKFVYGICLASLRSASVGNGLKTLFKIVYVLDKYVS